MAKRVSTSELVQFYNCQRAWYIQRVLKIKGAPFLPFIIGGAVHNFIAYWLHKKTKDNREFYYKSVRSVLKVFAGVWLGDIWPQYNSYFSDNLKWWALNEAKKSIANYMLMAEGKGYPLYIEKRLTVPIPELGCNLVGVIDQIRPTNPVWAQKQGIKLPGTVLIDLKTGKPQYWLDSEQVSHSEQLRIQTSLVNSIQPTIYYFLYHAIFGEHPDAFLFWFLGGAGPRIISTTRDARDIENMFDTIKGFMRGISGTDISEFPKTPDTYKCRFCQFWNSCWQRKRPKLSIPFDVGYSFRPSGEQPPLKRREVPRQLRFKIRGTLKRKPTFEQKKVKEREEYKKRMRGVKKNIKR